MSGSLFTSPARSWRSNVWLLSSPRAFANSLEVHRRTLGQTGRAEPADAPDETLAERLRQPAEEEWADDEAKAQAEEDALQENSRFFRELTATEQGWLAELAVTAQELRDRPDSKTERLIDWINTQSGAGMTVEDGKRFLWCSSPLTTK